VTRNQIWITVGAVAAALALGIVVTLVVTGGDDTDEISTSGTRPTQPIVTTTIKPATTPPPTAAPPTTPPTVAPTVVVVPPTNAPTSPPTVAPTNPATTAPTIPPTTKPTVPPTTTAPSTDPGITATEIRLAVIADSQDSVTGLQAWATTVNKKGIGGRKIVIDPFIVNGDPSQFAAAVDTACAQDFAIVGSLSAGDTSLGQLTTCGIPDLPARALSSAHMGAPDTYAVVPTSPTRQQIGGFKWLRSAIPGCCKQFVISSTDPAAAAATQASAGAAESPTVGFTSAGGTTLAGDAPQSAYTAVVDTMQQQAATFGRSDLPFTSTINLRNEAQTQGFAAKAWFCLAQCYQPAFLSQGGAAVEDQLVQISTNPFEDSASIPAMKKYLANGGPRNQAGLESAAAGLLFQNAANQVIASEGKAGITRAALLDVVRGIDDFNAGGILGLTDVGGRVPNGCFVMMKVDGGKFVRAEPDGAGQISCGTQNLLLVGP
jgi:hypothetical protein